MKLTHNINKDKSEAVRFFKEKIIEKFGDATYQSWFKPIEITEFSNNYVTLKLKSRFVKEWISCNYADDILKIFKEFNSTIYKIDLICSKKTKIDSFVDKKTDNYEKIINEEKKSISSTLNNNYKFEDFIIGEENIVAFSAAKNIAENFSHNNKSNLLYIQSLVGLGKTHLLHAIAHQIKESKPNRKITYISSERFSYNYVKSLKTGKILDFKDELSSTEILLIDDIQFLAGKKSTQMELLHIVNLFESENKTIVFTADKPLTELENIDNRLISKLSAGFVTKINQVSKILLAKIAYHKFSKINIDLSKEWLEKILNTVSSIRDIEGILNKFHALKSINQSYNFDNLMHVILNDFNVESNIDKILDIDKIINNVTNFYNVTKADLKSKTRKHNIVKARQIVMYLAKELTSDSLDYIGKKTANRGHATVIYSINSIENQLKNDQKLANEIANIKQSL